MARVLTSLFVVGVKPKALRAEYRDAALPGFVLRVTPDGKKSFEMDVHKKLASRLPDYRPFLERTIAMFYDLKDVFHKQHYVHPEFKGSVSIKKVLPALVPSLQYKDLGIHGGAQASDAWWTMVSSSTPTFERDMIATDLKTYCKLDTYAMYAIWKHLQEII